MIAYSPMYKGLLTGAFDADRLAALAANDHRRRDPRFQPPQVERHLALVDRLRPIAERNDRSLAALAIAWVLHHEGVTAAIVGARRPQQIAATVSVGDWVLSAEDRESIDAILDEHAEV